MKNNNTRTLAKHHAGGWFAVLCALSLGSTRADAQSSLSSLADVGVVNSAISP